MENSKYYTPSIEEFHVGFEYYGWTIGSGPYIFTTENSLSEMEESLKIKAFTCKYLDRQDIEAEGWIHTGKDEEFDYIGYSGPDNLQLQYWEGQGYSIEKDPHAEYKSVYFCGNIRNRSELRTLMNMLGITKK